MIKPMDSMGHSLIVGDSVIYATFLNNGGRADLNIGEVTSIKITPKTCVVTIDDNVRVMSHRKLFKLYPIVEK